MENLKKCNKCGSEKPNTFDYFTKTNSGKTSTLCKECKLNYDRNRKIVKREELMKKGKEYREHNKERLSLKNKEWREKNPDKLKQYRLDNKEQISQKNKEYREKNREELLESKHQWNKQNKKYNQEYRKQNKERDKEVAKAWEKTEKGHQMRIESVRKRRERLKNLLNNFTNKDWKDCLEYFDHSCAYCGEKTKLENDHFIAVVKGGHYTKTNILCSCRRCNASKDDADFFEWYPLQYFYDKKREEKILNYIGRSLEMEVGACNG